MNHPMRQLLTRWAILALGVALATGIVPGITCRSAGALVVVVLLLSFFNAILKPILVLFTLPFIIVTMGLGIIVINALLFLLAANLVDGFAVQGFWSAVGGAIVVSLTNLFVSHLVRTAPRPLPAPPATPANPASSARPARRAVGKTDDVIDI
jgi:putative membrane protein